MTNGRVVWPGAHQSEVDARDNYERLLAEQRPLALFASADPGRPALLTFAVVQAVAGAPQLPRAEQLYRWQTQLDIVTGRRWQLIRESVVAAPGASGTAGTTAGWPTVVQVRGVCEEAAVDRGGRAVDVDVTAAGTTYRLRYGADPVGVRRQVGGWLAARPWIELPDPAGGRPGRRDFNSVEAYDRYRIRTERGPSWLCRLLGRRETCPEG